RAPADELALVGWVVRFHPLPRLVPFPTDDQREPPAQVRLEVLQALPHQIARLAATEVAQRLVVERADSRSEPRARSTRAGRRAAPIRAVAVLVSVPIPVRLLVL